MPDEKKTSHEVLAEKRLEIEQAVPPYKPHEVKEGAVLPGQTYEKYKSMDPKDFEEWMKAAPDMEDHPYAGFFDPKEWTEFKERKKVEDPKFWEEYLKDDTRRTQYTREQWLGEGEYEGNPVWKYWADTFGGSDSYNRKYEYERDYLEKRRLKERETPDPSKLLS